MSIFKKVHEFSFGQIIGRGKNITEAKKDAMERAEKSLNFDYTVEIFEENGIYGMLSATPLNGYETRLLNYKKGEPIKTGKLVGGCTQAIWSREEAKKSLMLHVAQTAWEIEFGVNTPNILKDHPELVKQHQDWCKFQLKFKHAERYRFSNDECHKYASGHFGFSLPIPDLIFDLDDFDSTQAMSEGWDIFFVNGKAEIEKDDDVGNFMDDYEAENFVVRMARAGSWYHTQALALCNIFIDLRQA